MSKYSFRAQMLRPRLRAVILVAAASYIENKIITSLINQRPQVQILPRYQAAG